MLEKKVYLLALCLENHIPIYTYYYREIPHQVYRWEPNPNRDLQYHKLVFDQVSDFLNHPHHIHSSFVHRGL